VLRSNLIPAPSACIPCKATQPHDDQGSSAVVKSSVGRLVGHASSPIPRPRTENNKTKRIQGRIYRQSSASSASSATFLQHTRLGFVGFSKRQGRVPGYSSDCHVASCFVWSDTRRPPCRRWRSDRSRFRRRSRCHFFPADSGHSTFCPPSSPHLSMAAQTLTCLRNLLAELSVGYAEACDSLPSTLPRALAKCRCLSGHDPPSRRGLT
jgi:hypothetical protein